MGGGTGSIPGSDSQVSELKLWAWWDEGDHWQVVPEPFTQHERMIYNTLHELPMSELTWWDGQGMRSPTWILLEDGSNPYHKPAGGWELIDKRPASDYPVEDDD
jgi:hypothetical protein